MTSLPLTALLALALGLGALAGPTRTWREGVAAALAGVGLAAIFLLAPGPATEVPRAAALALLAAAAFAVGVGIRAAVEMAGSVRGRWVAWLPLGGAAVTAFLEVAPVLLQRTAAPTLALARATVGTEQQTRDLLLPIVQPMAAWVGWGWLAVAIASGLLLHRAVRGATLFSALLWSGFAAAVGLGTVAAEPTKAFAEALARAALHPGEKLLNLQPLPAGPFAVEPNFYAVLALLAAAGAATAVFAAPTSSSEPSGEPAGRGLVASLLAFALLATVQQMVGLALPTMHGMAGILLVAALCFTGGLVGAPGSIRFAARLLLALLLLLPWLLWGSLGALP